MDVASKNQWKALIVAYCYSKTMLICGIRNDYLIDFKFRIENKIVDITQCTIISSCQRTTLSKVIRIKAQKYRGQTIDHKCSTCFPWKIKW